MNTGDKGDVAETLPNLSKVYSVGCCNNNVNDVI